MVTTNLKQKAQALALGLITFLALCLPSFASADLCGSIAQSTGGFFSCGTATTSFTQFSGTLSTPQAGQYGAGLAANQDLRQYIKNVVNFALGFLGIIAVVVVIYGGFLYVTAAGNEEQAGKGKKALTYAVIGILIILSSFALVNTILLAGGGSDQSATNGSAPGATAADQNARRAALFAYAGTVVQTIARDFVTAYQNYSEINTDLATLVNVDFAQTITSPTDLKNILQQKQTMIQDIIGKAGALSQVAEVAQKDNAVFATYINASDQAITDLSTSGGVNKDNVYCTVFVPFCFLAHIPSVSYSDFNTTITNEFGASGDLPKANGEDFAQAVAKGNTDLTNLYKQIQSGGGISPDVTTGFKTVFTDFGGLVSSLKSPIAEVPLALHLEKLFADVAFAQNGAYQLTSPASVDNAAVLKIVNDMSALYDLVKNLQFEYTVITADKTEGNAPLPVSLDGLKSLDPNNHTIDPSAVVTATSDPASAPGGGYLWDFGDASSTDKSANGATATHIFSQPGTYVVKLLVKPPKADAANGEVQPADGAAYQTIIVHPAVAHINMDATIIDQTSAIHLMQYSSNGALVFNSSELPVTLTESKAGIGFDISKTQVGQTDNTAITDSTIAKKVQIQWDFGDKTNPSNTIKGTGADTNLLSPNVKYNQNGTYLVTLQITDDHGVTDYKIFNVSVGSLAARVQATPGQVAQLGDQLQFDSLSASDAGPITNYDWTLTDKSGKAPADFVVPSSTSDSFKYTFAAPGTYNVGLAVANATSTTPANTSVGVTIKSKPPVGHFTYTNSDPTHPNVYVLDGSGSFDPDMTAGQTMTYKWDVNSAPGTCFYFKPNTTGSGFADDNGKNDNGTDCTSLGSEGTGGFSADNSRLKFKFKKGKYTVTLDVQDDPADVGNSISQEQAITVDNDLDVGWSDDGSPLTAQLSSTGSADIQFKVYSENGVGYQIETGDGGKETGTIVAGVPTPAPSGGATATIPTHTYTKAGAYKAKLTVYDAQDNGNATYRQVFIGAAGEPIAAIAVNEDGENIGDTTNPIVGNRTTTFTFDASKSLNTDGTGRNLNYSWDFGDGQLSSKKNDTHTYKDIADAKSKDFTVKLTVTSADDATKTASTPITITIKRLPPVISGISAIPVGNNLTTPVQVNLSALGATDPDGKIVSYKWWYYDISDPNTQLGVQITQNPTTTLTVGTNGVEGDKKTYKFGVIATDNDGDKFDSTGLTSTDPTSSLNDAVIPSLDVVNGPNKAPIAKFSVDHTSINVGDSVNFSSSSMDPDKDGKIVSFMWNFDGTGYTNPGDTTYDKANTSFTYTKANKDGYKVRLKVRDNNGAESISDPVTVYVDSKSGPPAAAFTSTQLDSKNIQFTSNSTADAANGATLASYAWDFDVNTDANGDGIKDNDVQSTSQNPTFQYSDYGIYRAKLTVTDDQGNTNSVTNFVNVKAPAVAAPQTQQQTPGVPLQAKLTSTPATSVSDNKIHLQGDSENVTFDFSGSTGNIATYAIDKNIYYDSDGDGNTSDDADYKANKAGTWTTTFFRSYGTDTVRLTVTDTAGKTSTVDKAIIFDPAPVPPPSGSGTKTGSIPLASNSPKGSSNNQLSAFVLAGYEVVDWQLLLVSMLGFGIFIISTLNKKKHARNKSAKSE